MNTVTTETTETTATASQTDVEPVARSAGPSGDESGGAAADRLVEILNDAAIAVMAGLGHDLGLFDTLAGLPAATSGQVADAAGLDERYVREWLGGMVTARLVDYDPDGATYLLRDEYAPLVSGPTPDNVTRSMRYINLMGRVSSLIAERFRHGGGLAYADYEGFHDLQAEESGAVNDAALVDAIVPSAGLAEILEQGADVADIGCGQGHAVNLLARAFPRSRFTGIDFSAEALTGAREESAEWGLTNTTFLERDVATLDDRASYDVITAFDAIHDQADPAGVLANIHRALRPGGTFLMVDLRADSALEGNLDLPWATFLYAISTFHCMSVSLGQGGAGLGTVWGVQTAERMLREAGFSEIERRDLEDDPFNAYFVAQR